MNFCIRDSTVSCVTSGAATPTKGLWLEGAPVPPAPPAQPFPQGASAPWGSMGHQPARSPREHLPTSPKNTETSKGGVYGNYFFFFIFTALLIIPCPFLHSKALSQGFKAGRTPLAATRSPHPNPRLSSFWVLHLHCSSPGKTLLRYTMAGWLIFMQLLSQFSPPSIQKYL